MVHSRVHFDVGVGFRKGWLEGYRKLLPLRIQTDGAVAVSDMIQIAFQQSCELAISAGLAATFICLLESATVEGWLEGYRKIAAPPNSDGWSSSSFGHGPNSIPTVMRVGNKCSSCGHIHMLARKRYSNFP